uniref:Uncharacterized protein n=1 Tax=Anguilla anguilla TaxID=7936 RepID=A0A0E9WIC1_ANGAN
MQIDVNRCGASEALFGHAQVLEMLLQLFVCNVFTSFGINYNWVL